MAPVKGIQGGGGIGDAVAGYLFDLDHISN